jgi:hypothetical protein
MEATKTKMIKNEGIVKGIVKGIVQEIVKR